MLPSKPCNKKKKKDEKKKICPSLWVCFAAAAGTLFWRHPNNGCTERNELRTIEASASSSSFFFLLLPFPPLSLYLWAPRLYLCPDIQACQSQPRSCGSKSTQPGWSIRRLKLKLFGVHRYKIVIVGGGGKGAAVKARACAHLEMMMTIVTHFRCRQVCPDDTVYPGALCRRIRSDNWRYYYGEGGTSGCRSC